MYVSLLVNILLYQSYYLLCFEHSSIFIIFFTINFSENLFLAGAGVELELMQSTQLQHLSVRVLVRGFDCSF